MSHIILLLEAGLRQWLHGRGSMGRAKDRCLLPALAACGGAHPTSCARSAGRSQPVSREEWRSAAVDATCADCPAFSRAMTSLPPLPICSLGEGAVRVPRSGHDLEGSAMAGVADPPIRRAVAAGPGPGEPAI